MDDRRRILLPLLMLAAVVGFGAAGYVVIEGWSVIDSVFMTVITLATVGYGETNPLTHAGRIYTIILILVGMGVLLYGVTSLTAFVVEGRFQALLRRRRMRNTIRKLSGHTIVCGAGRTGRHVIDEMRKTKTSLVVIESSAVLAEELRRDGVTVVEGDATQEDVLQEAAVEKAGRMIACLTDDKDNLFVVLTARGFNARMRIVARYVDEKSVGKLKKAGADAVVSPTAIGGLRLASEALRPAVVSFLDTMLRSGKGTLRVSEVTVGKGSKLAGRTIGESRIREQTGALVLSLKEANGEDRFNPPTSTALEPGQILIFMGEPDGVRKLQALAAGKDDS